MSQTFNVIDELLPNPPLDQRRLTATYPSVSGTSITAMAQLFTGNGESVDLARVQMSRYNEAAPSAGQAVAYVFDQAFQVLAVSSPADLNTFGASDLVWVDFHFPEPVTTSAGGKYFIAAVNLTAGPVQQLYVGMGTADSAHAGQLYLNYLAGWNADSNGDTMPFQVLSLAPVPPEPPVNVAYSQPVDVMRELGGCFQFSTTSKPSLDDALVLIAASDDFIDSFCGHDWYEHSVTEDYDALGLPPRTGQILLKRGPLLSVELVEWWNGHAWEPAAQGKPILVAPLQGYEVYLERAEIRFYRLALDGMKMYRVTYTYGYPVVPASVRRLSALLSALKVLATWTGGTLGSYSVGDVSVSYPKDGKYGVQWEKLQSEANRIMYQLSLRNFGGGFEGNNVSAGY